MMATNKENVETSVGHRPAGAWEFDGGVTAVFDDMLERSIPEYRVMRRACFDIGSRFIIPKTTIMDLGASRGGAVEPFIRRFGAANRFVLVERSQPMVEALEEKFGGYKPSGILDIRTDDLRYMMPKERCSLVLSILAVQFTPIEYRLQILWRAWESLIPGGALIFVEKILGETATTDALMTDLYLDMKRENGFSEDDIAEKRKSLEGVLVPVTAKMNEGFLRGAGFQEFDCFWRWMNFAGWIAIKR